MRNKILKALCVSAFLMLSPSLATAQNLPPSKALIDSNVIDSLKEFVNTEIVTVSIKNQNTKYGEIKQDRIDNLDQQWRSEYESDIQPMISAVLSNPLSSYLTRVQAHSIGLYTEIFVMDAHGLNVGQSNISSDFWQGDEDKFQKTFPIGSDSIFIDEPEYNAEQGTWTTQVNMSIADPDTNTSIGAITIEVNLTELERRKNMGL